MKSKVLSLVLALTVLCSILSVSTVSYAAEKGEEILFDGAQVLQNPKNFGGVAAGNIGFAGYGRDEVTGPIIQVSNTTAIGGANGEFAHFPITHNFNLNSPYTLEFEYYAKNKVNVALALGDVDIFVHFGGSGKVALTNGTALGYVENATLTTSEWHKVAFTYNGTQYSLYVDEKLIGTFDAFKSDITGTETMKIGVYSGTIKENNAAIVAVDEVYAYQSVYEPEVSDDPVEPSTTLLFDDFENSSNTTAKMAFKNLTGKCLTNPIFGDDDNALVFSISDTNFPNPITAESYPKDEIYYSNDKVTFEVDIFKDNTLKPVSVSVDFQVGTQKGTFTIAKFTGNGTITSQNFEVEEDGTNIFTYPTIATYTPNRWYKIAATYDKVEKTMSVYINGELLLVAEFPTSIVPEKIGANFKIAETHTPYDGVIPASLLAVDNYRISSEAYDTTGETAKVESDALDSNTIYVDDAYSKTVATVKDLISSGDATIKFYADDTYATELADTETITATTVLVATSPNETVREYYTFKAKDAIELTKNSITGMATASVYFSGTYTTNHKLMIAAYSADNELLDVDVVGNLTADALTSAKVSYVGAERIKAFVWDNNLKPKLKEEL